MTHDRLLELARRRLAARAAGLREPSLDDVNEELIDIYEDDLVADAIDSGDEPQPKGDDEDDGADDGDGEDE